MYIVNCTTPRISYIIFSQCITMHKRNQSFCHSKGVNLYPLGLSSLLGSSDPELLLEHLYALLDVHLTPLKTSL